MKTVKNICKNKPWIISLIVVALDMTVAILAYVNLDFELYTPQEEIRFVMWFVVVPVLFAFNVFRDKASKAIIFVYEILIMLSTACWYLSLFFTEIEGLEALCIEAALFDSLSEIVLIGPVILTFVVQPFTICLLVMNISNFVRKKRKAKSSKCM